MNKEKIKKEEEFHYKNEKIEEEKEILADNEGEINQDLNKSIDKSIEIDESKFQKQFCINLGDKTEIYSVYELSNNRITILDNVDKEVKIYSLKNWKLIIKINQEYVKSIIELKNNDLVINSGSTIYFINYYKIIIINYIKQ